ncbi:MAG: hypothetical protein II797_02950, partial [Clostridia bacterium]|nr:hypothetical protein [Clostridia bacterium]
MDPSFDKALQRFTDAFQSGELLSFLVSAPRKAEDLPIRGRPVTLSGSNLIQIEYALSEGRLKHENVSPEEFSLKLEEWVKAYTSFSFRVSGGGCGQLRVSKKGKMSYSEDERLKKRLFSSKNGPDESFYSGNNRAKKTLLSGSEPFLCSLGISDESGRVKDKRQSKFRQICRFSEIV